MKKKISFSEFKKAFRLPDEQREKIKQLFRDKGAIEASRADSVTDLGGFVEIKDGKLFDHVVSEKTGSEASGVSEAVRKTHPAPLKK